MGELIAFLREETEKKEYLIEKLISIENGGTFVDEKRLSTLLQSTYHIYHQVDGLREEFEKWIVMPSNRVYEAMKAIIAIGMIPENGTNSLKRRFSSEAEVSGYLYVIHLFQMYAHAVVHALREDGRYEYEVYRIFNHRDEDLKHRSTFLDLIRSQLSLDDKLLMRNGVEVAFAEIQELLRRYHQ